MSRSPPKPVLMPLRVNTIPDPIRIDAFKALLDLDGRDHVCGKADIDDRGRYSDRACSPEETFSRVSPLLPRYGVTRLARQTGLDHVGIPVWSAIRPNSLSLAVNQGKGIGDSDAKISAVMEALERAVAGEPEIPSRIASRAEIQAEGLATDSLDGLIGRDQAELTDNEAIAWVEGYDLVGTRPVWVPREAVMLDRTMATCFWQSSDGLASGNTPLEATFHGLLERIERDADVLWSLAKSRERAERCTDPAIFRDVVIDDLASKIRKAGLQLQLFDITSNIGIPCFQALIGPGNLLERQNIGYAEAANGSGCHPDPIRAVIRAITEAAQSRLTLVSGSRDDIPDETYSRPLPKGLIEDFSFRPSPSTRKPLQADGQSLPASLQAILQVLRQQAIATAIAVPLNALDAEFSVVKVLVPGLESPPGARQKRFGSRALAKMLSR